MLKAFSSVLIGIFLSLSSLAVHAAPSPVGNWLTIDDHTHKERSIVQITESKGELEGKIIKIYYQPGETPRDVCTQCTDPERKDQPFLGMKILWGLRQQAPSSLKWIQGWVLDPKIGKTYHAQIKLAPDGQQLTLRGYIGLPLIGRSQTWLRTDES